MVFWKNQWIPAKVQMPKVQEASTYLQKVIVMEKRRLGGQGPRYGNERLDAIMDEAMARLWACAEIRPSCLNGKAPCPVRNICMAFFLDVLCELKPQIDYSWLLGAVDRIIEAKFAGEKLDDNFWLKSWI